MHEFIRSRRRGERGQTILLVAVSMVALLAMAALAIDVVTFYVARTEIQRAADAAALAGAKAIADSGLTSLPTADPNFASGQVQTLAQSVATSAINAVLATNLVGGSAPSLVGAPVFSFGTGAGQANAINDPTVKVTLQQTNLPTFFAKIFGRNTVSVQVSATAEAYNPANMPSPYLFTPIAPKCVKPWLVANVDPINPTPGTPFVDETTGAVEIPASGSVIGETFYLRPDCSGGTGCNPGHAPRATNSPPVVEYLPAAVLANASNICPSCATGSDFEKSVACCDVNPFIDGGAPAASVLTCGGGSAHAQWDNNVILPLNAGNASSTAAQCLIHAASPGNAQGQDTLDPITWPGNPLTITAGTSSPFASKKVTTSSSIVTIPLIHRLGIPGTGGDVTVVGFLQGFINCVTDGATPCFGTTAVDTTAGDIQITVLNVVGCSNNPNAAPPVVGGMGTSPVPVRLITPP